MNAPDILNEFGIGRGSPLMKKLMILASMLVAGCTTGQAPLDITAKPVSYKKQDGFDSKNYVGDVQLAVRSYEVSTPEGKGRQTEQEIAGSTCKLSGAGFSSNLQLLQL